MQLLDESLWLLRLETDCRGRKLLTQSNIIPVHGQCSTDNETQRLVLGSKAHNSPSAWQWRKSGTPGFAGDPNDEESQLCLS